MPGGGHATNMLINKVLILELANCKDKATAITSPKKSRKGTLVTITVYKANERRSPGGFCGFGIGSTCS